MTLSKWPGPENPSDLYTKHLCRNAIMGHLHRMNMTLKDGRAEAAPIRTGTTPCIKPTDYALENLEDINQCEHQLVSSDVFVDEGLRGLGGCPNPSHGDSAWSWYDMLYLDAPMAPRGPK